MEASEGRQSPDPLPMVCAPITAPRCTLSLVCQVATATPAKATRSYTPKPTFSTALQFAKSDPVMHPFANRTSDDAPAPPTAAKSTAAPTTGLRLEDSARSMEGLTASTPLAGAIMPTQLSGGLSPASASQPNPLSSYLAAAAAAGYDIPEAVLRATRGGASLSDSDVGNLLYAVNNAVCGATTHHDEPLSRRGASQPPSATLLRSPRTPFLTDPVTLPPSLAALPQAFGQSLQPRWASLPRESTTQGSTGHAFGPQGLIRSGGSLQPMEGGSSVDFLPFDWGLPSPSGVGTPTRAPQQQRAMTLEPQDVVALCAEALLSHGMQVRVQMAHACVHSWVWVCMPHPSQEPIMALQRVSNLIDHFAVQQPQYARLLGGRPRQGPSQEDLLTAGLLSGLGGSNEQRHLLRGVVGGGMRVGLVVGAWGSNVCVHR